MSSQINAILRLKKSLRNHSRVFVENSFEICSAIHFRVCLDRQVSILYLGNPGRMLKESYHNSIRSPRNQTESVKQLSNNQISVAGISAESNHWDDCWRFGASKIHQLKTELRMIGRGKEWERGADMILSLSLSPIELKLNLIGCSLGGIASNSCSNFF